ncbi:matrixin family metalloprotease [Crateriforma spongiae]|uniref:matrixin family metalloprotease n=1 Tax=Crateriforma spongiae TaxID=2724528 RepID=UPI001445CE66|nr:matrixin family metalloprotease [Crateriforma spongiae]
MRNVFGYALLMLLFIGGRCPAALTIDIDYTFDTNNFFGAAGSAQREAIEAAAGFFENTISQNFAAITPGGDNSWDAQFFNPATGGLSTVSNATIAADTIRIYVGGRNLGSSTLGQAGRGGWSASGFAPFFDSINRGDSATQFGLWGGSATFNTTSNWNFSVASGPSAGQNDFYSVALHELGHVLGLSATSDAWDDHWIAGTDSIADANPGTDGQFTGPNALAAYNADNGLSEAFIPTVAARLDNPGTAQNEEDLTNRHFARNTMSYIYGTTTLQEIALDPDITVGTRKLFTNVDVAALSDIGWQVTAVPEPSTWFALAMIGGGACYRRRRQRAKQSTEAAADV